MFQSHKVFSFVWKRNISKVSVFWEPLRANCHLHLTYLLTSLPPLTPHYIYIASSYISPSLASTEGLPPYPRACCHNFCIFFPGDTPRKNLEKLAENLQKHTQKRKTKNQNNTLICYPFSVDLTAICAVFDPLAYSATKT